jgi:hypothetical protein
MEYTFKKKTYWIALGEFKSSGILNPGDVLETINEVITFESEFKWKLAMKEHGIKYVD